ncbi:hypothetical protein F5Y17DRAFT_453790 [Xylariaceae sp. FL0594]|nr:hypothetical protein F5Y17DRAFT_453790 [Xylariaceae sp. FL0594]
MPCSRCFKKSLKCVVSSKSSRCSECVRTGVTCDGPELTLERVEKWKSDVQRLNREEEEAEKGLEQAKRDLDEAKRGLDEKLVRLARIREQQRLLRKRGDDMAARASHAIDEEDGLLGGPPFVPPLPNDFDWSGVDLGSPSWLGDLGSSAWVGQGVGGGTAQSPPEPSQGAS